MTSQPLVSIVVPTFNCASYLRLAVQSVLDQDYPEKEIIVVDDGSTDNTAEILAEFGSRIVVINQPNSGIAAARNIGLQSSHGDLIAFLDSDDYWLPGKLRRQVEYLSAHPEVGAVYCGWHEWRPTAHADVDIKKEWLEAMRTDGIQSSESGMLYNQLLQDCIILTSTLLLRREIREGVGLFDSTLRRGQDYDYWLRMSRLTHIHKLSATLVLYRIHTESITHKPHQVNYPCVVIEKALGQWGYVGPDGTVTPPRAIRRVLAKHWFDFGYLHLLHGDPGQAFRAFLRSGRLRPGYLKSWSNAARSLIRMAFSRG